MNLFEHGFDSDVNAAAYWDIQRRFEKDYRDEMIKVKLALADAESRLKSQIISNNFVAVMLVVVAATSIARLFF